MKKLTSHFTCHVELFIIAIFLMVSYEAPFTFHIEVLWVALLFLLQYLTGNKLLGKMFGGGMLILAFLFLLALLSEFYDFEEINSSAWQLLLVGMLLWSGIVLMGISMIYKYLIKTKNELQ